MRDNDAKELLLGAKELLTKGWNRDHYARDSEGNACDLQSPNAVSFCLAGALTRVARKSGRPSCLAEEALIDRITEIEPALNIRNYADPIVQWNDDPSRTKEEVISLLDDTLEKMGS